MVFSYTSTQGSALSSLAGGFGLYVVSSVVNVRSRLSYLSSHCIV